MITYISEEFNLSEEHFEYVKIADWLGLKKTKFKKEFAKEYNNLKAIYSQEIILIFYLLDHIEEKLKEKYPKFKYISYHYDGENFINVNLVLDEFIVRLTTLDSIQELISKELL